MSKSQHQSDSSQWTPQVPRPLQRIFDRFPLIAYDANQLPARTPGNEAGLATLYVFIAEEDARLGAPSFNPACLKWQKTFLKLTSLPFRVLPSTNHASPSGSLPFLLAPPNQSAGATSRPLPPRAYTAGTLQSYVASAAHTFSATLPPKISSPRLVAYQSLLDHPIRRAWLHALYLDPHHSYTLTELYLRPASSSFLVRAALARQLRKAAEQEISKGGAMEAGDLNVEELYKGATEALQALEVLLGERNLKDEEATEEDGAGWFFDAKRPTLFDAAVFTWVHLIFMDGRISWMLGSHMERLVKEGIRKFPGLMAHHDRLWEMLWPGERGRRTGTEQADRRILVEKLTGTPYTESKDVRVDRIREQGEGDSEEGEFELLEDIRLTESLMRARK